MKAGIVLVNKYCNINDRRFSGYINYIDRDEATRNDNMEKFNLYQDYMDNPEKSTGVFTEEKDFMSMSEKQQLKKVFQKAQENGSLMWQPVISFDNEWLEENGLYDRKTGILDEVKMKEFTRKSVRKMLHNENLDHAIWSASFHYNTDNIHIHIAVVEPVPMREQRNYTVYDYVPDADGGYIKSIYGPYLKATSRNLKYYSKDNARYRREVHLDEKGNECKIKGYVGPFKQNSMEICKSTFVNEVLNEKEYGIKINSMIRDSIVRRKNEIELAADPELQKKFLELYQEMPKKGNRGLWNYNSNIIEPLRPKIDELSELYIEKYHSEEFAELKKVLNERSEKYHKAYGDTQRNYAENQLKDMHVRLGNAILKEMRQYDKEQEEIGQRLEKMKVPEREEGKQYGQMPVSETSYTDVAKKRPYKTSSGTHTTSSSGKNRIIKEITRNNERNRYRLEKAIRALRKSMDQEYEKASMRNQLEHDQMEEKNR